MRDALFAGIHGRALLQHRGQRLGVVGGLVGQRLIGGGQLQHFFHAIGLGLAQQPLGQAQRTGRVCGDLGGQRQRGVQQLVVGHNRADQPHFQRRRRVKNSSAALE